MMELEPREGTFLARIKALEAENAALRQRIAELEDRHQHILTWLDAYPLDEVEPDILEESE